MTLVEPTAPDLGGAESRSEVLVATFEAVLAVLGGLCLVSSSALIVFMVLVPMLKERLAARRVGGRQSISYCGRFAMLQGGDPTSESLAIVLRDVSVGEALQRRGELLGSLDLRQERSVRIEVPTIPELLMLCGAWSETGEELRIELVRDKKGTNLLFSVADATGRGIHRVHRSYVEVMES